jgi:hypothetical protein
MDDAKNATDAKKQLVDKLNSSNNILVTVSRNPSVDQLASCIGLTLLLNKQGKHTAAVFSGTVPSTLEFLQPEDTLEKTTDSLRDFIISLDKSKADKLRYKVEDNVVRIFITPYRTSISTDDLEFTQGDFNVDVVVALGVQLQEELDEAITAHGRILHDATLASISTSPDEGLGTINWHDPQASSLSELVTDLAQALDSKLLDNQIATALLTGIVAETDRFSNDRTNSQTMSTSAILMAAGANQQLIATKLEEAAEIPLSVQNRSTAGDGQAASAAAVSDASPDSGNGLMQIDHNAVEPVEAEQSPPPALPDFGAGSQADNSADFPDSSGPVSGVSPGARMITEPPTLGGILTANSRREMLDPATDSLGMPGAQPPQLVDRTAESWLAPASPASSALPSAAPVLSPAPAAAFTPAPAPAPAPLLPPSPPVGFTPPPPAWVPPPAPVQPAQPAQTQGTASPNGLPNSLAELEASVQSPHLAPANLDAARDEVSRALNSTPAAETTHPEAIQALNAQPLGSALHGGGDESGPGAVAPIQSTSPLGQFTPPPAQSAGSHDDFGTNPGPTLDDILGPPLPASPPPPAAPSAPQASGGSPASSPQVADPTAPPPVPPPIPFQFGSPPAQ